MCLQLAIVQPESCSNSMQIVWQHLIGVLKLPGR